MELVIPGLCLLACAASIFLMWRRRHAKALDYGLQLTIWLSAWILWQSPAIVPAERHISLDSKELASALPVTLTGVENISLDGIPLSRDALRDLSPMRLELSDNQVPNAGWEFDWPQAITLGDPLRLQIHSDQPLAENFRLSLLNPFGDIEESLELKAGERVQAQLSVTPKRAGPQLYRVRIESTLSGNRSEPLPTLVQEPRQPKVLVWLARPSFETAALSRWLRQSGVAAQVMTQLAPEIIRKETLNGLPVTEPEDLLAEVSPFDLVILDSDLWPQLSPQQKRQLHSLASKKSLLWLVSSDLSEDYIQYTATQSMPLQRVGNTEPDVKSSASFSYQKTGNPAIPSLRTPSLKVASLSRDDFLLGDREAPLFWGRSSEEQHLGFILFNDSHRWLTGGFATEFASLWKSIIDYQLKHLGTQQAITLSSKLPRTQERITLCSPLFSDSSPNLLDTRNRTQPITGVSAGTNAQGPCYSFWPRRTGWHQLKTKNAREPALDFYIFAKEDWALWQQSLSAAETLQMTTARLGPIDNAQSSKLPIGRQWPALILLLLVCLSWWRERTLLR
ncbi:hypothetical protein [uncultured Microbulbifer sp.]|nr:hypothetical protein [uncultured Microbulbifer sp.]